MGHSVNRGPGWITDYGLYGFYIHKSIKNCMNLEWIWLYEYAQQLNNGSGMDWKSWTDKSINPYGYNIYISINPQKTR